MSGVEAKARKSGIDEGTQERRRKPSFFYFKATRLLGIAYVADYATVGLNSLDAIDLVLIFCDLLNEVLEWMVQDKTQWRLFLCKKM